ncbi:MAG: class I SAM-dependent methyltransferase [Methanophagales archaeon]|nr:class I SAM-dependent methyltransferase [Methanophagales archaeon]
MNHGNLQKKFYEETAEFKQWENLQKGTKLRFERIRFYIELFSKKLIQNRRSPVSILDVGCSDGLLLSSFVNAADKICYGIDINEKALKVAKERGIVSKKCNVEYEDFPFSNCFFDVVVMSQLLEHTLELIVLSEIYRVLKKEGFLILTTPNVDNLLSWIMMIFMDLPPFQSSRYKSPHVRDFTLRTLKLALIINGFVPIKIEGFTELPISNNFVNLFVFNKITLNLESFKKNS